MISSSMVLGKGMEHVFDITENPAKPVEKSTSAFSSCSSFFASAGSSSTSTCNRGEIMRIYERKITLEYFENVKRMCNVRRQVDKISQLDINLMKGTL